jgi:hypothetical protein
MGNFLFGLSSSGILVSTDIGVAAWAEGSMFFENVDPMPPMTHFPAQLEAVSWPKKIADASPDGAKHPAVRTQPKNAPRRNSLWRHPTRSSSLAP